MDITLNDGTLAKNVSVLEYEQLKERGLVGGGNTYTTNGTQLEMPPRCWRGGIMLNSENISDFCNLTYPPKYTCRKCEE